MEKLSLKLPAMYGDHHVSEVRSLLSKLPGVAEIYASSSFQMVEVDYDEAVLSPDEIKAGLDEAGYLGELPMPVERGASADRENGDRPFFRKSAVHEQVGPTLSFAQKIPFSGRPLWPCPGMGPIETKHKELENG